MSLLVDIGLLVVAVVSAAIAAYGWERANSSAKAANRSAAAAEKSADEAERSSIAAEDSLKLARSERDRAIEPRDVIFERSPQHKEGVYTVRNVGSSDAHDVTVHAYINDELVKSSIPLVAPGEAFTIDGSAQYAAALRVAGQRNSASRKRGFYSNLPPRLVVTGRVSWTTGLGTPGVQPLD